MRKKENVGLISNQYIFGKGIVSCGFAKNSVTNIPSISIGKLEAPIAISTDLMFSCIQKTEKILITFENMEGFLVFEKMVKKVKKELKKNIKL
jgi:hypothetical protein